MKPIIITNLFFGSPPGYFDLFLKSCEKNPAIDFLFFVDFEIPCEIANNIRFVKTTFQEILIKFQSAFDFPITLSSYYKLTDFQPAYGQIFFDYFNGYEWWGHCDFDMIFGDLSPLAKIAQTTEHVKILRRGHLTLYKNTHVVNTIYQQGEGQLNFKRVFSSEKYYNFDETNGIDKIFANLGFSVFREELIADISRISPFLFMTVHPNHWGQYFVWCNGKLYCECSSKKSREFVYIHLQKRKMVKYYKLDTDTSGAVFINQFGLFDYPDNSKAHLLKALSLLPNLAHIKRLLLRKINKKIKFLFNYLADN